MLKKILALLMALAVLTSLAACGGNEQTETNPPAEGTQAPVGETTPAVVRDTFTMAISYMPSSLSPGRRGRVC